LSFGACGDGLLTVEETLILCGFEGFHEEYVPVFLAGKNVYRTLIFQEGVKIRSCLRRAQE